MSSEAWAVIGCGHRARGGHPARRGGPAGAHGADRGADRRLARLRAAAPRSRPGPVSTRREVGTAPRAIPARPRRVCPLLVLAGLALAVPLEAQEVTDYPDRFELFTGCLPVRLFVDVQGDQAEEMGLTEERRPDDGGKPPTGRQAVHFERGFSVSGHGHPHA